ncbi:MAG: DUF308 domain-containing protein [Oscillospiraceae bacterium]|nr:DUF308 domain-containing protein [Oscillospiraceae bacterium]
MKTLAIITGILTAILGIIAFTMPLRVFLGIGWILGALILINGVETVVGAFSGKKDIWQCILGIIIAVGGGIILFNTISRAMTDAILAYLAGIIIIAYGISAIVSGFKGMKESETMGILAIICGVLSIIAGCFSVMHPVITMVSLGYLIAFNVIMQGINIVVMAFAAGKMKKAMEE